MGNAVVSEEGATGGQNSSPGSASKVGAEIGGANAATSNSSTALLKPSHGIIASGPQAAIRRKSAQLRKQKSASGAFFNVGDQTVPALSVCTDAECQTDKPISSRLLNKASAVCSCGRVFLIFFIFYFSLCFLAINTSYVQTLAGYAHFVKWANRDLTDLNAFGLPQARNIQMTTEDGLKLKGWHLMNPSLDLLEANSCGSVEEREVIFDRALANAKRIIVFFHGNSATRGQSFRVEIVKKLAVYLDAHVIAFDYRGFADSEGSPSEQGTLLDGRAVVRWIEDIVTTHRPDATGYLPTRNAPMKASTHAGRYAGSKFQPGPFLSSLYKSMVGLTRSLGDNEQAPLGTPFETGSSNGYNTTRGAPDTAENRNTTQQVQPRLYLYGHSLGSAISVQLAVNISEGDRPFSIDGLVLDAPFTTMMEAAKSHPITAIFRMFPFLFRMM